MIKIEFFHDVICSFCFPMSARMHRIAKKYNNIEVIHRSFALGWEPEDFIRSFGSREAVKSEVLGHWVHANDNDDDHRFNINGMSETDFNFPISKPGLIAAKAAGIIGGDSGYWEAFDKIQHKLFVENKNIEDIDILEEAIRETNLPFADWKTQFEDIETEKAVLRDLELARAYGVKSVPTIVINQKHALSGAQSQESIESVLEKIAQDENIPLKTIEGSDVGASCSIVDEQWKCD